MVSIYTIRIIKNGNWETQEITRGWILNTLPIEQREFIKAHPKMQMMVYAKDNNIINIIKE